jgi:Tfp pilus assembly protein PilN
MIRINLLPTAKRKRAKSSRPPTGSRAGIMLAAGVIGWFTLAGAGYYKLDVMAAEALAVRDDAKKNKERADEIRKLIDEDALQARLRKVEDLKRAIEKLEEQRRTPVYVMFELASILSTGKLPDIDEEKQRKIEAADPQAKLNPSWDSSSVWLTEVKDDGSGLLSISGSARDPADLDEFVKRMRSSVRFSSVSHADFSAKQSAAKRKGEAAQSRQYTFSISAMVGFWN